MTTPRRSNPFFKLVVVAGGLFAFTVMCLLASTFGHPDAPPNRFLNEYGLSLILVETVLCVVLALLAMAVDRWQTLSDQALAQPSSAGTNSPGHDSVESPAPPVETPSES